MSHQAYDILINIVYMISAALFIVGLKKLGSPKTAKSGNIISAWGMLLAVVVTLADRQIIDYSWIVAGLVVGTAIGAVLARRTPMTGMPEMVGALNGFGGLSSFLVGVATYIVHPNMDVFTAVTVCATVLIGGVTFTGSVVAWAKLSGHMPGRPLQLPAQRWISGATVLALLVLGVYFSLNSAMAVGSFYLILALSLILGLFLVCPIGGADMPVVISLLNSYSGLAASAAGFVLQNNLLIVAGALVGASGIILSAVMCKAMNRSLSNVLFSGFGSAVAKTGKTEGKGKAQSISVEDAYYVLEAAKMVVVVPGYGLAVAQAQHAVRELAEKLEANGAEVFYAIHPVAGRMPGHMNVLLAEANVPYEQLIDMDDVNARMEAVDVVLVIGANDVVNPAAREDKGSPIYGMPVINVDQAKCVYVLKRSMASGFSGLDNPLFYKNNVAMIFGDAKQTLQQLVAEFKG